MLLLAIDIFENLFFWEFFMARQFYKFSAFVCIILEKDNKVLLIKRANTGHLDGFWSLPGGSLDEGETLAQAVIREAHEEVNVHIDPKHLKLIHTLHLKDKSEILGFFFSTTSWTGELKNNEPERHSHMEWFEIDNLPENFAPSGFKALHAYKKKILYSEGYDLD